MKQLDFQKSLLWFSVAVLVCLMICILTACSSTPKRAAKIAPSAPSLAGGKSGGYYLDDGPADVIPSDLDKIPDAVPKQEPLHKYANRPYSVQGVSYVPNTKLKMYTKTGKASWYGKKFHGKKTASGEPYDMFAMTAAHPTLPIPSYVKVFNPKNERHVIVRINDRGPFHSNRIIDLSYTAAYRLGFIKQGSTTVKIEQILFDNAGDPIGVPVAGPVNTPPSPAHKTGVSYIQVGAYRVKANAETMAVNLKEHFEGLSGRTHVVTKDNLYRVWIGPFDLRDDAVFLKDKISDRYGFKAILIDS